MSYDGVICRNVNQRTNYAHLISGTTINKTISFVKFGIVLKRVKVIYIKIVEFEYIMLQANFQDHRTIRQKKKVNCFSGPPSSVSNAPHLSFFQT